MIKRCPRAALALVGLFGLFASGCDSPDKVKAKTNVCLDADEIAFRVPKKVKLASGVDYAEMVRQKLELDPDKPEMAYAVKLYNVFSTGTKCKGAKEEAACLQVLATAPSRMQGIWQGPLAGGGPGALMIRITKGDAVSLVLNPEESKSIYLPIDTPEEAAVIALGKATVAHPVERTVKCDGPPVETRGDGTYVVTAEAEKCEGSERIRYEQRVGVKPDGKITILGEKKVGTAGACVGGDAGGPKADGGH